MVHRTTAACADGRNQPVTARFAYIGGHSDLIRLGSVTGHYAIESDVGTMQTDGTRHLGLRDALQACVSTAQR